MADDDKPQVVRDVQDRVDRATGAPHQQQKYAEGNDEQGAGDALDDQQRQEAGQSWAGPGVPTATDAQWKGLLIGSLVGGAIGLVLFLPLALIRLGALSTIGRVLLVGIVGAFCGGTAGALYMGGRLPELEGETVDADGRPSRGTPSRDPSSDDRGR